ncbi:MAG TPA: hypothetical protein VMD99_13335 [Terriglobales bacterium]|nr:hypothetical protein [Terriglobales bacterium]
MSWSTNIACRIPDARLLACAALIAACLAPPSSAQELRLPASASAGEAITISATGSGRATFYLAGPGISSKSEINLGEEIRIPAASLHYAGEYLAILCSDTCRSASFDVNPAQPATLSFLVHPSRVPDNQPDSVSGVAFPFDHFSNLVLAPLTVNFHAAGPKESLFSRSVSTHDGVAWFRTSSGKAAGALHITASIGDLSAQRVLAQVASDPCNLRITGARTPNGILVETAPVHDCAGNQVSDGTIVTFTAVGSGETSTVDAPVKGDVARARLTGSGPVVISVASGVAMGNELHIAGAEQ